MEQAQEEKTESLYANAVKQGLIVGAIVMVLTIVAYATSLSFMGSLKFLGCILILYIGYVIYAGISYRNGNGRYISYGKAYVHGFIVLATAGVVGFVFGIVLYDLIDPELPAKLTAEILANTEDTMRNFGAPENSIDERIEEMRKELPEGFTMLGRLKNSFTGLIYDALIVLLTSLVVRKSEPVEM